MRPSEVRSHVLHDHEALRERIDEVERLAEQLTSDEHVPIGRLRQAASGLLKALSRHMDWEDRYLVPALREADAWGPERVARFEQEHVEQRAELERLLASIEDAHRPAQVLADRVRSWIHELEADMQQEESAFLDPKVLRDDVVGIDVETG